MKKPTISAVLTCAGNGCRFGHNKLMFPLAGKPVFIRTVEQFFRSGAIDEIVIAVRKEEMKKYNRLLKKEGLKAKLVEGGQERHISAYNAVKQSQGEFVLIHDGARPLVSPELIKKVVGEVKKYQAVMTAAETLTCVKYVEGQFVKKCLPRVNTWLGQTPHAFAREIILKAYKKAFRDNFVGMDDCDFVSRLGIKVKIVPGEQSNIKITLPQDLVIAQLLYQKIYQERKNV